MNNYIKQAATKIAILTAMYGEAVAIINHFALKEIEAPIPLRIFSSSDNNLIVSINGMCATHGVDNIGTDAATLNTYLTIQNHKPDLIINCGTAGGFQNKDAAIGDVYMASGFSYYHDRSIPISEAYKRYAMGKFPLANTEAIAAQLNFKQGNISSSNSINYTKLEMEQMIKNEVHLKDMEAASIAWVCSMHNQPLLILKAITDLVDTEENAASFLSNFDIATKNLSKATIALIAYLSEE